MSRQNFWNGITPLSGAPDPTSCPERVVKLCSVGEEVLALALNHSLHHCDIDGDTLSFRRVPGILALDLACDGDTLYIVDTHGRLFKSPITDVNAREEIVVREEARCCPHGFKTSSYKVKFRSVVASEFGRLFVSNDGQLWGSGVMPQIALDSDEIQKITFFEGRTVYSASLGSNFAAVISRRNVRRSGNYDTDSEDEEEVFASDCVQCRAIAGPASPPSAPSPSETCPLGVQLSRSSDESSSSTPAQSNLHPDAHSLTEDSSQSTEESKIVKIEPVENPPTALAEADPELNSEPQPETCEGETQNNSEKSNNIFMNTDAARQFLSRQLSWVSVGEDYLVEYTEKPTRIIKENVSNLTNLVYEGVKTVGDKVATLSRHVSGGSESCEPSDRRLPEPIDSLLYSCTSSYKLDELQFSTSTIASEKECENIDNEKSSNLIKLGRNILSTELWTWGDTEHGQLGIGDMMKRIKPMTVTSLSGFGLQKVCCGKLHCTALALDGRMFGWGGNRFHQVSFESRDDRSSPVQFQENSNMDRVRDIASADDHTMVFTHEQNIYYMGKYPNEYTEKIVNLNEKITNETEKIEEINILANQETDESLPTKKWQNKCYHWRISSAGNISYTYVEESSRAPALPDLSIAQKILEEMLLIYNWLIKPFMKKSKTITVHTTVFETVCELYTDVLNLTALNVLSMWQYTEHHICECEISIIKNYEQYIYVYKKYLNAICNLICISGFSQIANIVDVPSSIYNLFSHQLPTSKQKNNKKTSEAVISLAFIQPLTRLSSYKCIMKSLLRYNAKKATSDGSTEKKLSVALSAWNTLIEDHEKKKRDAEITKLFWETTGKVIDQFKTPERRLIRESRSRPLNMVHAGRFSNHWFILLNDVFLHISGSTQSVHPLETIWVEPLANSDTTQNVIQLITPEETLNVSTSTSQEKTEWVHSLQTSIKLALNKTSHPKPPAVRTASYTFTNKNQFYKDAKYHGRWMDAKIHGHGRVEWPDGKLYVGQFQSNTFHGHGKMDIPNVGVYEGQWKDNLQNGYGVMKYTSGDLYEGHFKDGLASGHGVRRQGDFTTSTATIYLGEWSNGVKQGYGVMDDIGKGEKYLGSWSDNKKHGCGLIVTLDGIYYEGVFMQDVLTGHGVMVFEDGTHYEGEFRSAGVFSGKGVLTFSSGDKIEGSLHGAWTEGVKISSATLHMNVSNPAPPDNSKPNSFGKLCVAPHQKWNSLFRQCYQSLGVTETLLTPTGGHFATGGSPGGNPVDNKKIWQNVAVVTSSSQKATGRKSEILMKPFKLKKELEDSVDCLEVIPQFGQKNLNINTYMELKNYIQKACETSHHPLGHLVLGLTGAFNTTYGGVRVHPLLLSHAVKELKSITSRLYQLVKLLFPALPSDGTDVVLSYKASKEQDVEQEDNPIEGEVVSAASLLQPTLLPRVHHVLFVLYALHNKREDDLYWRRLLKWNRQPDITLMAFLGIDQKFWVGYTTRDSEKSPTFSPLKEQLFNDAVETLQQLKTTFSPIEKLLVIRSTFQQMTAAVQKELGESYLWSMDELFPVFHFVVVRARILQLGSEIHFVEDFLEPCMQHGELGIMFTTLKACYFQILQEKVTITS